MKKIIAREFLWLMVILMLAVPLAFLFLVALELVSEGDFFTETEKGFIGELYLLLYLFNVAGLYLMRLVVLAIQTLSARDAKQ